MNFKNKVVLVTGAQQGIGESMAIAFAKVGADVAINWHDNEGKANSVAKSVSQFGNKVLLTKGDVSVVSDARNIVDETVSSLGGIDILINNAGITGATAQLWKYDIKEWNKVIDINLNGTFNCCKSIVPLMIKNNYGRIVNIASVSGKDGNANASAYSSAKAGVIGLTKSLGKELAEFNIAVNAVTPAGAKTRILDQMSKQHVQNMLSKVPRGRFLELDELSSLVSWLSSEENSFSTAAVFDISGGRSTY